MNEEKIKRYNCFDEIGGRSIRVCDSGMWCRSPEVTALEEELDRGKFASHTAGETISSLESELTRLREENEKMKSRLKMVEIILCSVA